MTSAPASAFDSVRVARREDIQLLRALAVTLVVFFHSGIISVPNGFLGVDIFFVISGFLITSHIIRDIDSKIFSRSKFYLRRAKRLLPATYCTLFFTIVAAQFLLLPSDYAQFLKQLWGALTFTANIALWHQTGYFDGASATKPLLHFWSLSVEEQYYLLLPFLLAAFTFWWRPWAILAALSLSAILYIHRSSTDPTAAFFLLSTRAWELLIGSLTAELAAKYPLFDVRTIFKIAAFALLLLVPTLSLNGAYPFVTALAVTMATAFLLIGNNDWLKFGTVTQALSVVGDWSYSIYLVHWPLFVFATVICVGKVPVVVSACLIGASYLLGYLQFRFVEQRFRFSLVLNERQYFVFFLMGFLLLASPIPAHSLWRQLNPEGTDYSFIIRPNTGIGSSSTCDQDASFDETSGCKLPGVPHVALWGDSYAMQWGPGLAKVLGGEGLVQITKSDCGPLRGIAPLNADRPRPWAEKCIRFNESAFQYIADTKSIDTVVLSSVFRSYVDNDDVQQLIDDAVKPVNIQISAEKFLQTIASLREMGRRVLVIAPPPSVSFDIGACRERRASRLPVFVGGHTDCNFDYSDYETQHRNVIILLKIVESHIGNALVWPEQVICGGGGICATQIGQTVLYRDRGHLTYLGSILLAQMLHLGERVEYSSPMPR